jgi:adenylate kinase family enzyme
MNQLLEALKEVHAEVQDEAYILRGPDVGQNVGEINFDKTTNTTLLDFGQINQCYLKRRKKGQQHSIAWDACGCHILPLEMQLQLRKLIQQEFPNFYHEASFNYFEKEADRKEAFIERHKPFTRRRFRDVRRLKRSIPGIAAKRESLLRIGIDPDIIERAIEANSDTFTFVAQVDTPEAMAALDDAGFTVNALPSGVVECEAQVKSHDIKKRRVCVIGIPSEKRNFISKRLSSFYGVPMLTPEAIMGIASEKGLETDGDLEFDLEVAYHDASAMQGFVIEGYPITQKQAEALGEIDAVVFVDVDSDKLVAFQGEKRWCPACMHSYHLQDLPPKNQTACDRCGTKLHIRPEDVPQTLHGRLIDLRKAMEDVLDALRKTDVLIEIGSDTGEEEAAATIERILRGEKERPENNEEEPERL